MNYEFVFWDLDGPIWDPDVQGLPHEKSIKKLLYAQLYGDLPLPWEGRLFEEEASDARIKDFLALVERVNSGTEQVEAYKPYTGMRELLAEIPTKRQGIITNGWPQVQPNKLKLFGIESLFNPDLILTAIGEAQRHLDAYPSDPQSLDAYRTAEDDIEPAAYHLATRKTGKHFIYLFERALTLAGVDAGRCLMIGDDDDDIQSAQRVGMRTAYVRGIASSIKGREGMLNDGVPNYLKPDYVIDKGDIRRLREIIFK